MAIAVMQPYVFPYVGYFQLIVATRKFVFYDDVHYIKRGWINRNRILINGKASYVTVNVKEASQNKLINQIYLDGNQNKLLRSIELAYKKAPYFNDVYSLIESVFDKGHLLISELAIDSVKSVCEFLEIKTEFLISSIDFPSSRELKKENRLIDISKSCGENEYINAINGKSIYSKDQFKSRDINLFFLKPEISEYSQFFNDFVPGLSIIDLLMFNSKEVVKKYCQLFSLE